MGRPLSLAVMLEALATDDEDKVLSAKVLRLNDMNLDRVDNLELVSDVRDLYLHRNNISSLPDMSCLQKLEFLALQHNQIEALGTSLIGLSHLKFLDLSFNSFRQISPDQLPRNLQVLKFAGNPVEKDADLPQLLMDALPALREVNGVQRPAPPANSSESKEAESVPVARQSSPDDAFASELQDLRTGLGTRSYGGLQSSSTDGRTALGPAGAHANAFTEKRQAIIDKYKAEIEGRASSLRDMSNLVSVETSAELSAARERLKTMREAAVSRSHGRSTEADAAAASAATKLQEAYGPGKKEESEEEPVWKRVLARMPVDPDLAGLEDEALAGHGSGAAAGAGGLGEQSSAHAGAGGRVGLGVRRKVAGQASR